jgi:hypothetical protein
MPHGSAEKSNNEAGGKAGAAAEAEARRLEELASDPAHGGKITPGSMREAQVALGLEKAGRLPGPVTRDPHRCGRLQRRARRRMGRQEL